MLKALASIMGASVVAQIISILVMPWITRAYTPEILGEYQIFATICLLLIPIVSGSMHVAIRNSATQYQLIKRLIFGIQYSLFISILLLMTLPIAITIFKNIGGNWVIKFLPLIILFTAFSSIFQMGLSFLINSKRYAEASSYTLSKSLVSNFLKVLFSVFYVNAYSLIFALLVTESIQINRLLKNKKRKIVSVFLILNLKRFFRNTRALRVFPTYVSMGAVVEILMNWFPILITGFAYGAEYAGLLGLSFMVINGPVYPFIGAMKSVCFGELARDLSEKNLRRVYYRSISLGLLISLFILIILSTFGERIFELVFGSEWAISGRYALISFFPISLSLIFSPMYSTLNNLFGKQKGFFFLQIIFLVIGMGSTIVVVILGFDFEAFLITFSISMSINQLFLTLSTLYLSPSFFKQAKS
ncbi:oligosaccharide flippase family protein [Pseudidiomarina mangrovi]|uniref:oligosaccharide flippase family protein n=1 Tax=Pseudidiomarina mangrovi TaxID=2487133 RepID=UPI000FCB31DC|nr:oligosaccharide flippase family protein [Pseudidiomarina mangrovi]